tara:strand:+ start:2543 stop:3109 length:567 start_codon:yes stop_codon:yes gene_type:complete
MPTKVTDLAELAVAPASTDVLHIVDVGDTTGGPAGTSKKIQVSNLTGGGGAGILTQVETTVSNADVLTMKYNDTPITLVAAQAGKIIVPTNINIVVTWGSPNESSSDDFRIGWDASTSVTTQYFSSLRDFMNGIASGIRSVVISPNNTTFGTVLRETSENKPLQAWCTDVFNGGWSMKIYTTYYTITV